MFCFYDWNKRSRLCSFIDQALPSWDKVRHPEKHQAPNLKSKEGGSSSSASPSVSNIQLPGIPNYIRECNELRCETLEEDIYRSVQNRLNSSPQLLKSILEDTKDAVECLDADIVLLGKYIAVLSGERGESPSASEQVNNDEVIDFESVSCRDGFGPVDCDGVYLSSCGHAVHQRCLARYLHSLKER